MTIIYILSSVLILVIIALIVLGNRFYNLAINPAVSKDIVFKDEDEGSDDKVSKNETSGENKKEDIKWFLNKSNYVDEYIESFDGLKLHGYKLINKDKTNKWIIAVHGYTSNGVLLASYTKRFYDMGYNVLVPELRGHGKSEGNYIGMGWDDRLDILRWINLIVKDDKSASIILHGVSMGGATVMMVSGENLPHNVKGIIEDCGYTSIKDEFAYQLKAIFNLPPFPFLDVSSIICKIRAGYYFKDGSSIKQLAKNTRPMLFIHGDADDFVPFSMLNKVYNATNCTKEKLVIKGARHAKSAVVNPKLYWDTVREFIYNTMF